jgi:hypothetical protein
MRTAGMMRYMPPSIRFWKNTIPEASTRRQTATKKNTANPMRCKHNSIADFSLRCNSISEEMNSPLIPAGNRSETRKIDRFYNDRPTKIDIYQLNHAIKSIASKNKPHQCTEALTGFQPFQYGALPGIQAARRLIRLSTRLQKMILFGKAWS